MLRDTRTLTLPDFDPMLDSTISDGPGRAFSAIDDRSSGSDDSYIYFPSFVALVHSLWEPLDRGASPINLTGIKGKMRFQYT